MHNNSDLQVNLDENDAPIITEQAPQYKEEKKPISFYMKQMKYALPLICLPFILIICFSISSFGKKQEETENTLETSNSFNASLPDVAKNISDKDLDDKYTAYRALYGRDKDLTAINDIEAMMNDSSSYESAYTTAEQKALQERLDFDKEYALSKQKSDEALAGLEKIIREADKKSTSRSAQSYHSIQESQEFKDQFAYLLKNNESERIPNKEDDLHQFREQMRIMDSFTTASQNKYINSDDNTTKSHVANGKSVANQKDIDVRFNIRDSFAVKDAYQVHMPSSQSSGFNTTYASLKNMEIGIPAIIDHDLSKAIAGSRVRLRIMSDMKVNNILLKRGTYVYAFVTGFGTQRVNLTVDHIIYNSMPLPVSLDVYDNDGYMGLYVPQSVWREFSKEMGSKASQGMSQVQFNDGSSANAQTSQMTNNLIRSLFQTSSQSIGKLIKTSKVSFKYDYIIYLRNNTDDLNNPR